MADLDAWLLESIPTTDGIWSLYGIDDDRPMAAWSGPHHERAIAQRAICASRVAALEWGLNDVRARGASAAAVDNAEAHLSAAKAEWAQWDAQVSRISGAR
jgi:hypothetical protein